MICWPLAPVSVAAWVSGPAGAVAEHVNCVVNDCAPGPLKTYVACGLAGSVTMALPTGMGPTFVLSADKSPTLPTLYAAAPCVVEG